jgi:hypothetical protein
MPLYDIRCNTCNEESVRYSSVDNRRLPCEKCGSEIELLFKAANSVIGDDIPGGIEIRHGLCNEDGSPRRYYSKSEIAAEANRRGLVNRVRHVPEQGSDKSKHTTKWV